MNNLKLLKVLNPILAILFIIAASAIAIMRLGLFTALQESGVVYQTHIISGQIFIVLGILHIILNWNWIKTQIFGIRPARKHVKK